jgi:glycine oxidase
MPLATLCTRSGQCRRGEGSVVHTSSPDVAIVGGGAIGLAIAWRAAISGIAVAVVDDNPGRGSSWAAAGMLAPVTEVRYGEESLLALNLESSRRYPEFVAELEDASGTSTGYRRCGTVMVARDTDENTALEELYRFQKELGMDVERLRARECASLEPGLAPSVRGGILVEGDHQVDNRALVEALLRACAETGVRVVRTRAEGLDVAGQRVRGVRLEDGNQIPAGVVVVAAGCWSGTLGGLPPQAVPPVRPVKGQLLHLRGPEDLLPARRNVRGLECYVVGRSDGRVVIGATVEEQGFDTAVTAGAVFTLLRAAYEILPGIVELELVETVAGLRPGSPDNAPMLGESEVDGLVLATGHYRNGILLTPVTADVIAELLVDGKVPDVAVPFSPQRFTGRRTGAQGVASP